jgi:hypothetical protein
VSQTTISFIQNGFACNGPQCDTHRSARVSNAEPFQRIQQSNITAVSSGAFDE